MTLKNILAATAAMSLVTAPVVAQAAAPARAGAEVGDAENLRGGFVIPLIALIAVVLGILAATGGDDDDDLPTSP